MSASETLKGLAVLLLQEFHGSVTTHLEVPALDVFDLLVDVDRLSEWNSAIHHVVEHPRVPLAEGVEWVVQIRAMGTRWPSRSRALTVDRAGLRFEHRSCSDDGNPSYAIWSWHLRPEAQGSSITVTWTARPGTFWRRFVRARWRRPFLAGEVKASLTALDACLRSTTTIPR